MHHVAGLGLRGDEPSLLASRDCYATLGSFRCDGSKQCLVHNVFIDTRWATKIPEGYSIKNDPDYNYLYDIIQFFLVFLVILIPLIFGYRSYSKIVRYLAKYEKNKKFDKKMVWSCQRNIRSWNRIVENMSEKDKEFAKNSLPETEPYDLEGYWKSVYRSIETPDRSNILESELDKSDIEDFQIEELEIGEDSDEEYNSEDEQLEELLNSEFSKSVESFEETTATVEPSTVTFEV
ncbi:hypothetical protein B9Z55_014119 [Caenorhabditis nigoni]|nr:hypothetical protein B9Z55_014119 [Caenorhabditis nigoni]